MQGASLLLLLVSFDKSLSCELMAVQLLLSVKWLRLIKEMQGWHARGCAATTFSLMWMLTVQTDVVEVLLRTAKNEHLPDHCTAGLPKNVRANNCISLAVSIDSRNSAPCSNLRHW